MEYLGIGRSKTPLVEFATLSSHLPQASPSELLFSIMIQAPRHVRLSNLERCNFVISFKICAWFAILDDKKELGYKK